MHQENSVTNVSGPELRSDQALPVYSAPAPEQGELEAFRFPVPIVHYLWILRRQRWKIAAFVVSCVLITFVMTARLKPIYESTATIDVDLQAPNEVVGENSTQAYSVMEPEDFLATQMKLIKSDAVLRPVAEQFHLIGDEEETQNAAKTQQVAAAPVSLGQLSVTRPTDTYLLLISYRSSDAKQAADIANAVAESYVKYTYNLRIRSAIGLSDFMEKQLDELKAKMEQSSSALAQYEKDLDVINPDEKTNILTARLQQLNTEYTTSQVERIRAEAASNALKSGSIEAAESYLQTGSQPQVSQLSSLSDALNKARQEFALAAATHGSVHPEYRKAADTLAEVQKEYDDARSDLANSMQAEVKESQDREQILRAALATTKAEWDSINAKSFQYQRLKQEADTDKALYDELTKKIREGDINAGFKNNNIRVADLARPSLAPVYPNKQRNLLMSFVLSSVFAIGVVVLLDSFDSTLRNPLAASRFLGADVIGTLPEDKSAAHLPRYAGAGVVPKRGPKPSENGRGRRSQNAFSAFDESIRTLRNTILLSDLEGRLRSIAIVSAVPGEGKSTLAAHLAIANAEVGKKTLLVDGDLRRPSLSSKFGVHPREGLSTVLNGELNWKDFVLPIEGKPALSLLPAGAGSHRASDLIGARISSLLDEFAKEYDLVILDAPPLLGFAESLEMASAADGVLVTAIAGKTRRRAVAEVVGSLRRVHANVAGVILNQVNRDTFAEGYSYYGYYRYDSHGYDGYQYQEDQQGQDTHL